MTQCIIFLFLSTVFDDVCHVGKSQRGSKEKCLARETTGKNLLCGICARPIVDVVNQDVRVEKYPLHRPIMCAKCSSRAISSSVMFTMPRSFLNSAGTYLFAFGSSIDSVMNVTTICFCSRVMPRSSAAYGAIGVSLIRCANVVIILTFYGFAGGKVTKKDCNERRILEN